MKRSHFHRLMTMALLTCLGILGEQAPCQELAVDTSFEGASARIIELNQAESLVRIMPAGDPSRGWPAWWYCRISGLTPGQSLRLSVVPSSRALLPGRPGGGKPLSASWALPQRAAWSANGNDWQQTAPGTRGNAGMTYRIESPGTEIWIAWGPPATPSMTTTWLEETATRHEFAETFELAETLEGRPVRGIRVASGSKPRETRDVVWLHARQHAWESGSSWVARGVLEWLVGDSAEARWLRENTQTYIVPIMDVDRTATGDGGKESTPHDHNRDWSDRPHYPEVAAVQKLVRQWNQQARMAVFVDLHNPGPSNRQAYFYVAPDEAIKATQKPIRRRFVDTIADSWTAPIEIDTRMRSTGPTYHPLWQQISGTWVTQHTGDDAVAVCLETPWNTPHSHTAGYRQVGASLGQGIALHLQSD